MRYQTFLIVAATLWSASGCTMGGSQKQDATTITQLSGEPETLQYASKLNVQLDKMTKTGSGLLYLDRSIGTGTVAQNGSRVSVGYVGSTADGRVFDQSGPGAPYQFLLGQGRVIQGWDEGILGMKVGGKRLLVIRPSLAYGSASPGAGIPANATLVFEVSLDGVQ